jgi:hypothetical protein
MLPTEAKYQQCATSKTDPATLSKTINQILTCKAQREAKGRRAFAASRLSAGLESGTLNVPVNTIAFPFD